MFTMLRVSSGAVDVDVLEAAALVSAATAAAAAAAAASVNAES